MMKSNVTALTLAGILSVSSMAVFAQSSGGNPPVDKGGMPPSTEMEAGTPSGLVAARGQAPSRHQSPTQISRCLCKASLVILLNPLR